MESHDGFNAQFLKASDTERSQHLPLLRPQLKLGFSFWIKTFVGCVICKHSLLVCSLIFHSLHKMSSSKQFFFNFDDIQLVKFFLFWAVFLVTCLRTVYPQVRNIFYVSSKSFMVSCFYVQLCDPFGVDFCIKWER